MDKKFVFLGLLYAAAGMLLGIVMAASKDHRELVTHAHIMLVGFVMSFVYGLCHKLWLSDQGSRLAMIQFSLHQAGAIVMLVGLFLLYGNLVAVELLDPVLALASLAVLGALVIMLFMFGKSCRRA